MWWLTADLSWGVVSYLRSGCEDFDAAVVADVGGGVQQLLDVVDHTVQLQLSGHHALTGPEDKHTDCDLSADACKPATIIHTASCC